MTMMLIAPELRRTDKRKANRRPVEQAICVSARALRRRGIEAFHGYLIAREIKELADARRLTAYGTLYRALARLEQMGLLTSAWEDPMIAADAGRPRRRLYSITEDGIRATAEAESRSRGDSRNGKWQEA